MVGAQQNLNGTRDLTTPLSGTVCYPCIPNLESIPTHYEDMKGDTKCQKWGGLE